MSNKTLATHLYCLFLFVGGCLIFWLFGGAESENNPVENKERSVAQPTEQIAVVEGVHKNVEENSLADQSTELQEKESISSTDDDDAEAGLSDSKASLKVNSKRSETKKQEASESKENESTIPSSTSNIEKNVGFHRMGEINDQKADNSINAVIHEEQKKISAESQIKLRLLDDVTVEGVSIPKNTVVFAKVRLSAERIYLKTETVTYKKTDYPFVADIYDVDGKEGLKMTEKKLALPAGYKVIIKNDEINRKAKQNKLFLQK